jgi:tetratricopeptide (TPR) repeat protein
MLLVKEGMLMEEPTDEEATAEHQNEERGLGGITLGARAIVWGLRDPRSWTKLGNWVGATPRRIVLIGAVTVILTIAIVALRFSSQLYAQLSPTELYWIGAIKWVAIMTAAILAGLSFIFGTRGEAGRRRAQFFALVNVVLCLLGRSLDAPPKVGTQDVSKLERFNSGIFSSEHAEVPAARKITTLAESVGRSGETDPLKLAQGALAKDRLDESLRLLDKGLIELQPMQHVIAETHLYKGIAFSRLRRDKDALAEANTALTFQPNFAGAFALRCRSLRRLGNLEPALESCEKAIKIDGASAIAWSERGAVLLTMGERLRLMGDKEKEQARRLFENGVAALNVSLRLDKSNPDSWNNEAVAFVHLGKPTDALVCADAALRLKPDFADALLNKGTALKRLNRLNEAVTIYKKLTEINPDTEAWSNLGDAIMENHGNYNEALAAFDAALQTNPEFEDALFNRGLALDRLGRYQEALEPLDHALKLNPDDVDALVEKAYALEHLQRKSEALELVGKALRLSPKDPAGLDAMRRLSPTVKRN